MSQARRGRHRDQRAASPDEGTQRPVMSRRAWIGVALGGGAAALVGERAWRAMGSGTPSTTVADATPITVYSSPTCGCCHKWVDHMKDNGFAVTVESMPDVSPVKQRLGVPDALWSCHTGTVGGYAVEGHVPADLIQKMLAERPAIAGIAAPGMPIGSPGMEGPTKDIYEIISFTRSGETALYAVR